MATDQDVTDALQKASENSKDAPGELTAVVDELINSLSTKFDTVSSEIFNKMDEMSQRLDNLEAALSTNDEEESQK